MSKKSPNVVFKSRYSLALTCRDNKNKSLNYKEERLKDVDDMIDYYSDEKKKTVGMFEYYMGHTRKEKHTYSTHRIRISESRRGDLFYFFPGDVSRYFLNVCR